MDLCRRLESEYDSILTHVPLYSFKTKRKKSNKKRRIAEIDILAINKNYCDVYEVKCSYRIVKAKHQLNKIKKILSSTSKVRNSFFYCGEGDQIIKI